MALARFFVFVAHERSLIGLEVRPVVLIILALCRVRLQLGRCLGDSERVFAGDLFEIQLLFQARVELRISVSRATYQYVTLGYGRLYVILGRFRLVPAVVELPAPSILITE